MPARFKVLLSEKDGEELDLNEEIALDAANIFYSENKTVAEAILEALTGMPQSGLDPAQVEVVSDFNELSLPRISQPYADVYSYSGSGSLHGFSVDFNSDRVYCRLEIDGNQIFEIDCDDLESYFNDADAADCPGWIKWDDSKNRLMFRPSSHIRYSSSVKIQARANSNSNSRDADGYIVDIVKES